MGYDDTPDVKLPQVEAQCLWNCFPSDISESILEMLLC